MLIFSLYFSLDEPGRIVHVDETVVTRRNYHRGRLIPQQWALGMYDAETRIGYVVFVEDRRAETLIGHIQQRVHPGTEIWTDEFASYRRLATGGGVPQYVHRTVNHSQNFVDPHTGVCTNAVEAFWSRLKGFMRRLGVMSSPFKPEYRDQFMWLQHFGASQRHVFNNLLG